MAALALYWGMNDFGLFVLRVVCGFFNGLKQKELMSKNVCVICMCLNATV